MSMAKHVTTGMALGLFVVLVSAGSIAAQRPAAVPVQVFKDATCGCCSVWVEHLRRGGFAPTSTNVTDLTAVKDTHKVPAKGRSCHTALVGGYIIEGHVPAGEIQRLLKEKPAGIVGLAVPGMPIGSPGMEGPNPKPYDVLAFDAKGQTSVFSTQTPRPPAAL
jgi:hypothetical protein